LARESKIFKRLLNVVSLLTTLILLVNLYDLYQGNVITALVGYIIVYSVLLVLNYTIFNEITLWHAAKNRSNFFNIFILIFLIFSIGVAIYQSHKHKIQAEAEVNERFEKEKQQEECEINNALADKEDSFIKFLNGISRCN
jgi:hypothetical protein